MTVDEFIAKWSGLAGGAEKANFAPFIYDLVRALDLPEPEPAEGGKLGEYQFEAPIPNASFRNPENKGSADLYKRGCFIMEAKQSYMPPKDQLPLELVGEGDPVIPLTPAGARYDKYMTTARAQVENYAKNLPASEPVAPFLIVCDIGRAFEIYHDSAGNGRGYTFFPDKQSYRIPLPRLRDPEIVARLKAIWTDPRSIDPRFQAADVTREVAKRLASVSQYIEEGLKQKLAGKSPREKSEEIEEAALFLMRILFCMFAEDVGLLPKDKFKDFLKRAESNDKLFQNQLADLWQKMGAPNVSPRFAHAVEEEVKYFNGGLFSETARTYPLGGFVIHDLYEAARQNWRKVEPAIFGTLLEQALSAEERAKLGAHYTPRPYVETLVRATIMDVLEAEWAKVEEEIGAQISSPLVGEDQGGGPAASAAEETLPCNAAMDDRSSAPQTRRAPTQPSPQGGGLNLALRFHDRLASIRVLDPACGTGNFLYVSMELMQALESRVIETIEKLGGHAEPRVGPHQFYGLEKNPRAAKIAELVLWIGWLRNRLHDDPDSVPQPVLAESANINFGRHGGYDAVLKMNALGQPDLETPTIPDWPEAEFIVGNPPFIAGQDLREELGDDYAEALWKANPRVPKSADFVMRWWDRAAHTLLAKDSPLIRFGFVTTNSITQEFSRRVIAAYLSPSPLAGEGGAPSGAEGEGASEEPGTTPPLPARAAHESTLPREGGRVKEGLSLVMAIPDHPWTKATKDAAAVRIAMTVAERGTHEGELREVVKEIGLNTDEPKIELVSVNGPIHADLTSGTSLASLKRLRANEGMSFRGMTLIGTGFIVPREKLVDVGWNSRPNIQEVVRPYRNGRDIIQGSRGVYAIDFFGLSESEARRRFPEAFEWILRRVKPERDHNRRDSYRDRWWIFGEPRGEQRPALVGLRRYIATTQTAVHRIFQFLDPDILPDQQIIVIASDDATILGVLSSELHKAWALKAGGSLEDRPRYNNTNAFDPFPFPDATPEQRARIAELAEELDATRKAALAETDKLTMTELYNLVEWVRHSAPLPSAGASGSDRLGDGPLPGAGASRSEAGEGAMSKAATPPHPPTASRRVPPSPARGEGLERRATKARAAIVNRLHEQLDQAVADAYGWGEEWRSGALGPSEIVARLVALNHQRAAEEKQGKVRWLRPDYQEPRFGKKD